MGKLKKIGVVAGTILVVIVVALALDYGNTGSMISQNTFEKTRPETSSKSTSLITAYREASRKAVEDYTGVEVVDDYIYCYTSPMAGGMFYYCKLENGNYYRFWVNAGGSEEVYSYIVYGNQPPKQDTDSFDFEVSSKLAGLLLYASIIDAS